jgi:hypothetical protein
LAAAIASAPEATITSTEIARLRALEDLVDQHHGLAPHVEEVHAVCEQAAGFPEFREPDARHPMPQGELGDAAGIGDVQPLINHRQRLGLSLGRREGGLQLVEAPHFHVPQLDLERRRALLHGTQHRHHCGIARVREDGHPGQTRERGLHDLQSLGVELGVEERRAGNVPARSGQARHDSGFLRVADDSHHDGERRRRPFRHEGGGRPLSHDDVDVETDQLGRERGKPIVLALGPPERQRDVLALEVSVVSKPEAERRDVGGVPGGRAATEEADPVHLPGLLRSGGERCGEDSSQRRQQEAAAVHYSIT